MANITPLAEGHIEPSPGSSASDEEDDVWACDEVTALTDYLEELEFVKMSLMDEVDLLPSSRGRF